MGGLSFRETERADAVYRYSVRCDRATSTKIEAAARKAGISVTAFVQRHFESILDARPNAPKLATFDAAAFDAVAFSKCHHVSLMAAKLWCALRIHADENGKVQRFQTLLAEDIGCDHASTGRLAKTLIDAGLLETVRKGKMGAPATYRVIGEGSER
ncbi:MAG: hypothetical protein E5Y67_03380 [Mesorhizobium sp.]|uniref:hypothetical protein n=1 Tax=Mesorhizobium sp. TaxID=1871066 RepID=UPI00121C7D8C|nr:hypothetical protein [Mesorhizobium sp.]TIM16248.1 MAG: hypothetical protein E5Y67_03380 [Mesorhizobium sp.]